MHTDTSDQVGVFLEGKKKRSTIPPPNPLSLLHLFTNRTFDVFQLQALVLSRCTAPSPAPPAPLSPLPPRSFSTSPLHTLKPVSANSLPLLQVTQGLPTARPKLEGGRYPENNISVSQQSLFTIHKQLVGAPQGCTSVPTCVPPHRQPYLSKEDLRRSHTFAVCQPPGQRCRAVSPATSCLSQRPRQGRCAQPGQSRRQHSSPSLSLC